METVERHGKKFVKLNTKRRNDMPKKRVRRQTGRILSDTKEIIITAEMELYLEAPLEFEKEQIDEELGDMYFSFSLKKESPCEIMSSDLMDTEFEVPDIIEETINLMKNAYDRKNIDELHDYAERLVTLLEKKNEL
jgi:hypothetical protein